MIAEDTVSSLNDNGFQEEMSYVLFPFVTIDHKYTPLPTQRERFRPGFHERFGMMGHRVVMIERGLRLVAEVLQFEYSLRVAHTRRRISDFI